MFFIIESQVPYSTDNTIIKSRLSSPHQLQSGRDHELSEKRSYFESRWDLSVHIIPTHFFTPLAPLAPCVSEPIDIPDAA